MTSENFCYWVQSLFEVAKMKSFDEEATETIRKHLSMVFYHEIDPKMGDKEHQGKLTEIHHGPSIDLSDPMAHTTNFAPGISPVELQPASTANGVFQAPDYMIMTKQEWKDKYGDEERPRC
jgi:hypothetical protein